MKKGLINSISFKYALFLTIILSFVLFFLTYLLLYQKKIAGMADILVFMVVSVILVFFSTALTIYFLLEKPLRAGIDKIKAHHVFEPSIAEDKDTTIEISKLAEGIVHALTDCQDKIERLESELQQNQSKMMLPSEEYLINTEKLASLGKMVAGIIHEINSSLTGIITFSHLILKRMPQDKVEDIEDLKVIISQAERCSKFVSGLLSFSRQTISQKNRVQLNTLIEDTLSIIKNQVKFQNISFVMQYDTELPDLMIDENQIQQVFINILINAADAMNEKGKITITTSQKDIDGKRYIEVAFEDTGIGLPKDLIDRVFEPFFTTKPKGQGTGLGLAVCDNIIKRHGGHVSISSQEGKGTTFFIRLPIAKS